MTGMSLEDFLNHSTGGGGKGGSFLKWKDRQPPQVNVLLHTQAPLVAVWRHGLPEVREIKDSDTGETSLAVWGGRDVCFEDEKILTRQYMRDKKTGKRKYLPVICPLCILIVTVIRMIEEEKLGFCQPLFKFEGDDPDQTRVITAGGFANLYGKKDLSSKEKGAMRKAKIRKDKAWMENGYAKCNYIFRLVDVENPDEGIQISTGAAGLGDAVKAVIRARIQEYGDVDGHPFRKPYVIRWEHHPKAKSFNEIYRAQSMSRMPIPDAAMDLVMNQAPPSIDHIIKKPDIQLLRARLEQHALVELPWDEIFGPVEQQAKEEDPRPDPTQGGGKSETTQQTTSGTMPSSTTQSTQTSEEEGEYLECDICSKDMLSTAEVCPHCGARYDVETGELLTSPSESAGASKGGKGSSEPSKGAQGASSGEQWATDDDEDGIPF